MPKKPVWKVQVVTLPKNGFTIEIDADQAARAYLAETVDAQAVDAFRADLTFRPWRKGGVKVEGRIRAHLTQACVVSLEPIDTSIDERFEQTFLPEGSKLTKPRLSDDGEMLLDPEGADIPDLFSGDTIDAWDILCEQFVLAVDPFPRKGDVELDADYSQDEPKTLQDSPFAVLGKLKTDK